MKKKYIIISLVILLLVGSGAIAAVTILNARVPATQRIFLPTGSDYATLCDSLESNGCMPPRTAFNLTASLRGLTKHVKGGSYKVEEGMTVLQLVNKLYSGNQDALRVTIGKYRTVDQLCQFFGEKMEFPADSLRALLLDSAVCAGYGETPQTVIGLFPRNTYELYWTTQPRRLLDRMKRESDTFWASQSRGNALTSLGLSRQEVITLASIVDEETNAEEEKADIASVYLNRLRRGMPLQADPTVKYAIGDFSIRRILNPMLQTDSPYNTYRHTGLPPGPICIPSPSSVDAVLKNKKTDWFYFCAKEDFSGRHNFSSTLAEHQRNAARFHKALNSRNIH